MSDPTSPRATLSTPSTPSSPSSTGASSTARALPALLVALWPLLAAHRSATSQQRVFDRLRALVLGWLWTAGAARHTVTQSLLTLGLVDTDPSAFYRLCRRTRVSLRRLHRCFLRQTLLLLPATGPYAVVLDGVQLPRTSRTMPGSGWLLCPRTPPWKRGLHRAQFFVHLAALLPGAAGFRRALPLRLLPAFGAKAVAGAAPAQTEAAAGLAHLTWVRSELDAAGRQQQQVLAVADAHYDTVAFWRGLPDRVVLVVRTAKNRALCCLAAPGSHKNRKYGAPAPHPADWLGVRTGWTRVTLAVRGQTLRRVYRVEGPYLRRGAAGRPLFLLVVRGARWATRRRQKRREPTFLLVNAVQDQRGRWVLPVPAVEVLTWAWQRWEVEVTHRGMKHDAGVGQVQCWSAAHTVQAVQLQVWAYGLWLLAGQLAWGAGQAPQAAGGRARWWRGGPRWSVATLLRGYGTALRRSGLPLPWRVAQHGWWAEVQTWLHDLDAQVAAQPPAPEPERVA